MLVDNQADKIPHHGPALTSPIEANARAAQSDEGCDCARPAAVLGLASEGADQANVADCGTEVVSVRRSRATKSE